MKINRKRTTSRKALDATNRQIRALEMREAGMPYDRIAEELGYSCHRAASNAVNQAIKRIRDPIAEDVLWIELARLDRLLASYWTMAVDGDIKSGEMCLNIMKRRAALLGLDKLNVDLTTKGGKIGGPQIYIPQMDELFGDVNDEPIPTDKVLDYYQPLSREEMLREPSE